MVEGGDGVEVPIDLEVGGDGVEMFCKDADLQRIADVLATTLPT